MLNPITLHVNSINAPAIVAKNYILHLDDQQKINEYYYNHDSSVSRIESLGQFDTKILSGKFESTEIRYIVKSAEIDVISLILTELPTRRVSFYLNGNQRLFNAINLITAHNIPVLIDIKGMINSSVTTFDKIVNHFFFSKLLEVPIDPINQFLIAANHKMEINLAQIYSDQFGRDVFQINNEWLTFSKNDYQKKENLISKNEDLYHIINSSKYEEQKNFVKRIFVNQLTCARCECFSFCKGFLISSGIQSKDDKEKLKCSILIKRLNKIKFYSGNLSEDIKNKMHSKQNDLDSQNNVATANIMVADRCNNNCIFCAAAHSRDQGIKTNKEFVLKSIDDALRRGAKKLIFSGFGEPSLNPLLEFYSGYATDRKIEEIIIFTNGSGLSIEKLQSLSSKGVTGYLVSVHGLLKSHELATQRKGSFNPAISAIRLIKEVGGRCLVNTCLTKLNIDEIGDLVAFIDNLGVDEHSIAFPERNGRAEEFDEQLVSYYSVYQKLNNIPFEKYPNLILDNVPLCVVDQNIRRVPHDKNVLMYDNQSEKKIFSSSSHNTIAPVCNITNCPLIQNCCGVDKNYLRMHGDSELIDLRVNLSFNLASNA